MSFSLHPQLEHDTLPLGDFELCRALLRNDNHFPWVILVPRQENIVEITDLQPDAQALLWQEILHTTRAMQRLFSPDKMNIGMLGNQVSQLHCHVIARFKSDAAWPNPVWGTPHQGYTARDSSERITQLQQALFK